MTQAKHTPGPWHVGVRQAEQIVYDENGWAVANATVHHGESNIPESKANARLIAAAPDLLAALEAIAEAASCGAGCHDDVMQDALQECGTLASAAIAKAKGR